MIAQIGHPRVARQRHGRMRRRNRIAVVDLAIGGAAAVEGITIPGGHADARIMITLHRVIGVAGNRIGTARLIDATAARNLLAVGNDARARLAIDRRGKIFLPMHRLRLLGTTGKPKRTGGCDQGQRRAKGRSAKGQGDRRAIAQDQNTGLERCCVQARTQQRIPSASSTSPDPLHVVPRVQRQMATPEVCLRPLARALKRLALIKRHQSTCGFTQGRSNSAKMRPGLCPKMNDEQLTL